MDANGTGIRIHAHTEDPDKRYCSFKIVEKANDQSVGTIKGGDGLCPFPDCGRVINGDEIKSQAQAGHMGQQLYAIATKQVVSSGKSKASGKKVTTIRRFRAAEPSDDREEVIRELLKDKLEIWNAAGILPTEQIDELSNYDRGHRMYGMERWNDMFTHRQIYCIGVIVESWCELLHELREEEAGLLKELDAAALTYLTLSLDKLVNFNCRSTRWDVNRCSVVGKFDSHNYSMKWSFAEMAPAVTGRGLDWVLGQTTKALGELQVLAGTDSSSSTLFNEKKFKRLPDIMLGSANSLTIPDHSIDSVVIDLPYYDNVMYAELSDFFYVWLKRTAGLIYPHAFADYLTDKDREAVSNPAKFKGERGGAKKLAGRDYQERMAAIFTECRRVIKPHGVMTVMFTHKASGAWDALATGLV